MRSIIALSITVVALAVYEPAQAVPITGKLTIDPGVRTEQVVGADPETGEPITRPLYDTGSYFAMFENNPNGFSVMLSPGSAGGIVLGSHQPFVLDPDVPGLSSYSGTPTNASTLLESFGFFGVSTYVGTNPVAYQNGNSHPAPTASVDAEGNLAADLSAWEVMWNGNAFEQGPRESASEGFIPAQGTYDPGTGDYMLEWSALIVGGAFNGVTGYWHLEGTHEELQTVPAPSVIYLMGIGLIGLIGMRRRA